MEEGLEVLLGLYSSGNYDKCVSWLSSLSDSSSGMRLLLNIACKDKLYEEFLIENNFAVCQSIVSMDPSKIKYLLVPTTFNSSN